ncbi:MAG TPA: hypothetical protein VGV64_01415 [Thermoplasmata archaeon]|nr:hypothetical protein [Thermoplasmata archaeon]HEV2428492.1 hypothetical protein [Thermoplasmata archaeon]
MGGAPGPAPDLSNAEIVDYSHVEGDARVRLKLKDGSVIEVKLEIMNILRAGNDPNTGLPAYIVQSAPLVRLVECPKELRKSPQRGPPTRDGKSIPGFG